MMKDRHGIKDEIAGKFKEVEGRVTDDEACELEEKAQQAKGKVKSEATKAKEDLE